MPVEMRTFGPLLVRIWMEPLTQAWIGKISLWSYFPSFTWIERLAWSYWDVRDYVSRQDKILISDTAAVLASVVRPRDRAVETVHVCEGRESLVEKRAYRVRSQRCAP
jgi:hypothetical protein